MQDLGSAATPVAIDDDAAAAVVDLRANALPARVVGDPLPDPSAATRRLYAAEWARFVAWCRQNHQIPLPANPATVASYLLAAAPGLSRGTLGRRRAAIGAMHRQSGLPVPLLDDDTHRTLRASARASPTVRPTPPSSAGLLRLANRCSRDLPGLRDRALLLLVVALTQPGCQAGGDTDAAALVGAAGAAVPRLFLLALDAEHVRFTAAGMTLHIQFRADEAGLSRPVTLTRARINDACPVRAMEDWLRASDTAFGPVFRKVDRWGNVEHGRLHPDAWHRILARRGGGAKRRPRVPERAG